MGGVPYTQVRGRLTGYQQGFPDAFASSDGVQIRQRGGQHLWSYIWTANNLSQKTCLCTSIKCSLRCPENGGIPSTVGLSYFCDSGMTTCATPPTGAFVNNRMFEQFPFFEVNVTQSTADIEVYMCRDEAADDEDIHFDSLEIYVR